MKKKYKVQLHTHTKYSKDSNIPFWLLLYLCKKNAIDYIAITDHNNIDGAIAFEKYCLQKTAAVKVIVGEEIMTSEGEIIGLYITDNIPPYMSAEETINEIKRQNGIIYVPHPYEEKRKKSVLKEYIIKQWRNSIDCIECWNGRNYEKSYADRQEEIANRYHITKVIGSDAHTPFEIGKNTMCFDIEPKTREDFCKCIKNADFCKDEIGNYVHNITKIDRLIKLLFMGEWNELCRVIIGKIKGNK